MWPYTFNVLHACVIIRARNPFKFSIPAHVQLRLSVSSGRRLRGAAGVIAKAATVALQTQVRDAALQHGTALAKAQATAKAVEKDAIRPFHEQVKGQSVEPIKRAGGHALYLMYMLCAALQKRKGSWRVILGKKHLRQSAGR